MIRFATLLLFVFAFIRGVGQERSHLFPLSPKLPEDSVMVKYWQATAFPPYTWRTSKDTAQGRKERAGRPWRRLLGNVVAFTPRPFSFHVYEAVLPPKDTVCLLAYRKAEVNVLKSLQSDVPLPDTVSREVCIRFDREDAQLTVRLLQQASATIRHPEGGYAVCPGATIFWYKGKLADGFVTGCSERPRGSEKRHDRVSRLEAFVLSLEAEFGKRPDKDRFAFSPRLREEARALAEQFSID